MQRTLNHIPMNTPDLIPFYTESRFPCNPFSFTSEDSKVILALETAIMAIDPGHIDQIIAKDNYIQVRSIRKPQITEIPDLSDDIYLDEFAILKAIIHTLSGFDQDIVSYRVINVNSDYQNIITVILYHLLP